MTLQGLQLGLAFIGNLPPRIARKRRGSLLHRITDNRVIKRLNFDDPSSPLLPQSRAVYLSTQVIELIEKNGLERKSEFDVLGKGGFGTVFKAIYKGKKMAAKVVALNHQYTRCSFLRECNVLGLEHPNLLVPLLIRQGPKFGLVVMQRLSNNTLHTLLCHNKLPHTLQKVKAATEVCQGVQFLHENNILHLDIKPANVLISVEGHCKLADFGNSIITNGFGKFGFSMGTLAYSAPELLTTRNNIPTTKADIFSLGVTMWQLHSGAAQPYPSYRDQPLYVIVHKVVKENKRPEIPVITTEPGMDHRGLVSFIALYRKCWKQNPAERPNIDTVLARLEAIASHETANQN